MLLKRNRQLAGGTLLLAISAGCGDAMPDGMVQRDSMGVAIIESSAMAWTEGESWTVDSLPLLDLAKTGEGQYHEFGRVPGAMRRSDGSFILLDESLREIRAYAADGSFLWVSGRRGDGPGEYQRVAQVSALPGDSVLVFDAAIGRVTILSPAGEVGRVLTLPRTDRYSELYPLGDGSLIALGYGAAALMARPLGHYSMPMIATRLGSDGSTLDTLGSVSGFSGYLEGGRDWAPVFPVSAHLAVNAGTIALGSADAPGFTRYDETGRIVHIARAPALERPLTNEQAEVERAAMLRPETPPESRAVIERLPVPELWPSMEDLLVDALGYVWMADYKSLRTTRDRSTYWQVFSPDGIWLGTVRTPERFVAREIGPDYLVGWYDGRGGDYSVHVLALHR